MFTHFRWAVILPVIFVAGAPAQDQGDAAKETKPASPGEAEIRFADGSVVRATILQPHLEVQTRYGKLNIPTADVRRIEFGLHLTEVTRQRIDVAVRNLGSDVYKLREQAVRELTTHGPLAYPALQQAAKSGDLEVAQRAEAALKLIRDKVAPESLRGRVEDVIDTSEFPVVGRIVSQVIRVRTTYFGEIDLKLPELRTMRFNNAAGDCEVVVDASRHGSAQGQWLDTGYNVSGPNRLKIVAAGTVDLWPQTPGQYTTNPKGYTAAALNRGTPLPGTLLGKVGENGQVFCIGDRFDGAPPENGRLYLHIVPSPWNNASTGTYRVQISSSLLTAAAN
jgi:hypothetical protein